VRLKFSDLFEGLGYSARCAALSGTEVEIAGWIADSHDGRLQLLVAEPGGCPDCTPVPAIALPDVRIGSAGGAVTLHGTLSYGMALDATGTASFLRLENARVATGLPT